MSDRVNEGGPTGSGSGEGLPRLDIEGLSPMLESTSGRVQEVLQATDRAAEEIIRSAQLDAERYVEEARQRAERLTHDRMDRIASLTEDLMAQAGTIHRQAQDLRVALSQTLTKLSDELGLDRSPGTRALAAESRRRPASPKPVTPESATRSQLVSESPAPVEPAAAASTNPADLAGDEAPSILGRFARKRRRTEEEVPMEEARIAIVQMLASGDSRDIIETRLRNEFGIDDPSTVFAPASSDAAR